MNDLEWLFLALSLTAICVPLTVAWCTAEDDPEWLFDPDLRLLAALKLARRPSSAALGRRSVASRQA